MVTLQPNDDLGYVIGDALMYDLIIIGGGPAALSAASFAIGKHLQIALVYESLGGKVAWPHSLTDLDEGRQLPGNEVVRLLAARTTATGSELVQDRCLSVTCNEQVFSVATETRGVLQGAAVIIATGASPLRLAVPGANLVRHGLGYSIRTFGHLVAGKRVAVIGDTARAVRGAAELARIAAHVYWIAPREESAPSAIRCALRNQPNVTVYRGYEVVEVIGAGSMAAVRIASGQETQLLPAEHAFVDLGLVPNSDLARPLAAVDERGFLVVDHHKATRQPGLFAAGDVTSGPGEQVLVAVGAGAQAAMSAYDYLLAHWLAAGQNAA